MLTVNLLTGSYIMTTTSHTSEFLVLVYTRMEDAIKTLVYEDS